MSQEQEDRTLISGRGASRIRGGAVTQNFMGHGLRRNDGRRTIIEAPERQEKYYPESQFSANQMYQNNPGPRKYDSMYRQQPYTYQNNYDATPEIVPYGHSSGSDFRNNEGMKVMNDMMATMMTYQHNNFKAMIDSHTHLMNKLIDKLPVKKSKYKRN